MWRIVAGTVLVQTAIYITRPLLTYRTIELGAGELAVGALVVAFTLLPALVALPLGRFCDQRSPVGAARGGAAVLIAGALGSAVAPNLGWLLLATTVSGLGSLAVMVASQAEVARSSDRSRLDAAFGVLTTAVSVGQLIGPALGGWLVTAARPSGGSTVTAFLVAAGLCVAALGFLWQPSIAPRPARPAPRTAADVPWYRLLRRPTVAGGIVASAAILSAVDLLIAYLPLIGDRSGITPTTVGLLLSARAAASVLSRLFIPQLLKVVSPGVLLVVSLVVSGVLFPVLAVTGDVWLLAAAMVAIGGFLGLGQPLTMSMLVRAVPPADQGAALSLRLSGTKMGQVVMATVITGLTGVAGVGAALAVVGVSLAGAGAIMAVRRPRS